MAPARLLAIGVAATGLIAGVVWWSLSAVDRTPPAQLLVEARREQRQRHFAQAERLAVRAFDKDRQLSEAALVAGECAMAQQAWTRALDHLRRVESGGVIVRLRARLNEAAILHEHHPRLADAERAYRAALELDPDNVAAGTGLVQLLSLCARVREAPPFILRIIRAGAETELLLLLVKEAAVNNPELLQQARHNDPNDPNPLIGLAWRALQEARPRDSEDLLRSALQIDRNNVPARLLLGRVLVMSERHKNLSGWAKDLPPSADEFAEAWFLRGQMAEAVNDAPGSIRCYWEAVRRAPESKVATFRLVHQLSEVGEAQAAEAFRDRLQRMNALEEMQNRVLITADRGRPELLLPLARAYEAAGRLWEALGWSQFAQQVGVADPELIAYVFELQRRLQHQPLQVVTDSANVALAVDLSRYAVPTLLPQSRSGSETIVTAAGMPTFRDDAEALGLNFEYFTGVSGPMTHRMFEFTGGGVGVLDFDGDGWPDLFLTQGGAWPPGSPNASGGDRLFRNHAGNDFGDVTDAAGIREDGFGQGITIGDFNADGFPDVYVANIGANTLWYNRGDGTFADVTAEAFLRTDERPMPSPNWTTSPVMVDLTGDGLPDIYDVNYLVDEDVFERVCQHPDGSSRLCLPSEFRGQADRLWLNLGDGRFREATSELLGETPLGMGLGVAAWDAEGTGRLSLFVANDTTPCFYFRPDGPGQLRECGLETGVAFNGAGKATGAMGIAIGDVDDDGRMDLHITNFYAEPNTLFLNPTPGFFEDQTRRTGLEGPSFNMLGFGTQFLDADLDGRFELFVTNGHVDDSTRLGKPYRMSPQLFRWDGKERFEELPPRELGPYFETEWVGRAAARLDWNRDGRDDLVIGHLHDPVALLTNTTAKVGNQLSLQLFGVQSNRDAIGATVRVRIGSRTLTRQLTAGDGYQCTNERRLIFGAGDSNTIDELSIRWPSGLVQQFLKVAVPSNIQIREGRNRIIHRAET